MTDSRILGLTKTGALRVVVLGAFAALAVTACGGGETTDAAASGGALGSGGTATGSGGTATGSGGTATGTGGTATGTGGTATGTGGAQTDGGAGGEGGATAEDCPVTMPEADAECTASGFPRPTCTYGDQECSCEGFQDPTWSCGDAAETVDCPAEPPVDGEACTAGAGLCDMCFCLQDEWNCF